MKAQQFQKNIESQPILQDFEDFLAYFQQNKVTLTKAGHIGPKDCFALNDGMFYKELGVHIKTRLPKYPLLILLFELANASGFFDIVKVKSKKEIKPNDELLSLYNSMNSIEKYIALLKILIVDSNFENITSDSYRYPNSMDVQTLFSMANDTEPDMYFYNCPIVALSFEFFGWADVKRDEKYPDVVRKVIFNDFGKWLLGIVEASRKPVFWNQYFYTTQEYVSWANHSSLFEDYDDEKITQEAFTAQENAVETENFIQPFTELLPKNIIKLEWPSTREERAGIYTFKVLLKGQVKIWRRIAIDGNNSMDDLHDAIQKAYKFSNDHLYAFYPTNNNYSSYRFVHEEYKNGIVASSAPIEALALKNDQEMLYVFDFGNNWQFDVILESVDEDKSMKKYKIIEKQGTAPKQYSNDYW